MKAVKLLLIGLLAMPLSMFVFTGCGDDEDGNGPESTDPNDTGSDTGDDPDGGTGNTGEIDLTACDDPEVYGQTCQQMIDNGDPFACIAGFDMGTNQAGNYDATVNFEYIGFYAYNDASDGSVMTPVINNKGTEPAAKIDSCSGKAATNYALYMKAEGFVGWGAGVGMDWGGEDNPNCTEDAMDCLQIGLDNPKFALSEVEKAEVCQDGSGNVDEGKIDCIKRGKVIKGTKDLSKYRGIGFWLMVTPDNEATNMKVTFPIPATARFYGGENGCDDDDETKDNDCFNDYNKAIKLPATPNKWEYYEILFSEIKWDGSWGLQLDELGYDEENFPKDESMGLKFQIDSPYDRKEFTYTELYIDDVTLLPNVD